MSFRRIVRDVMRPKNKMLEKLQTSVAWIILISIFALTTIMKIRGYDIVLVGRGGGIIPLEGIESDKVFYFPSPWLPVMLLCIVMVWARW